MVIKGSQLSRLSSLGCTSKPLTKLFFKMIHFFMWTIFKVCIEFVTILLLFYVLLYFFFLAMRYVGFPSGSNGKESVCSSGDEGNVGSIPGLERSPAEGNCNPLQYSCLENPMDRVAWQTTVHGSQRVRHN